MGKVYKYNHLFAALLATTAFESTPSRADFALNFLPSDHIVVGSESSQQTYARCNITGFADVFCIHGAGGFSPDTTPFLRELVTIDGIQYVHMIVGELSPITGMGFAQETYVRTNGSVYSSSGGKPGCNRTPTQCGGSAAVWTSGNGQVASYGGFGAPLIGDQHTTGIGTGNPTYTVIRQVLNSAEVSQEFLKASLLLKPKITQTITSSDGEISSEFILDMSLIDYDTRVSGVMTNRLTLNNAIVFGESQFFDVVVGAQSVDVTGGQYTFTAGLGWLDNSIHSAYRVGNPFTGTLVPEDITWDYDAGSYTYSVGGADITNTDWQSFRNPLENP